MKTNTNFLKTAILIATIIISYACKGPAGDSGPIGPQGNNGTAGANGTNGKDGQNGVTGAKGDKGDAGTANVIYSQWSVINIIGSFAPYKAEVIAPQITQEILDRGVVLCFFRNVSTFEVYPLPYSFPTSSTTSEVAYASLIVGKIKLRSSNTLSPVGFRYVIIPGGVAGGRKSSLQNMSYEEVKALYNIKD